MHYAGIGLRGVEFEQRDWTAEAYWVPLREDRDKDGSNDGPVDSPQESQRRGLVAPLNSIQAISTDSFCAGRWTREMPSGPFAGMASVLTHITSG